MMTEIGQWLVRIAALLPHIISLWEAARGENPNHELEAALLLVRAMKNEQMKEELERRL